jgi:beta-phosphoglucomutase-like phosphatase (HAD superfamily)
MAGKNANMKVCAVYDEYSKKDEKQIRRLVDYYIYTMDEVLASIDDK